VIQDASAVPEDNQVGESVVVIVAHGHPHAEQAFGTDTRFSGDVSESAVSIIPVKRASQGLPRAVHASGRAIHKIEIEEPVLVVINPAAARTHRLD
jgi:hypothetical protein